MFPAGPGKRLTLGATSRASEGNIKTQKTLSISPLNPATAFRVVGNINGSSVSFLLDTGAAVTLMRKDVWDSLRLTTELRPWCNPQLVGVDGVPLPVHGCSQIHLCLGGRDFTVRVIVADSLTSGAILGLDFLQENDCTINIAERKLYISNNRVSVSLGEADSSGTSADPLNVHLVETVRVPAFSEMEVMGKPQQSSAAGTWLLEGIHTQRVPVIVANAIVTPGDAGIPVRVLNPTDRAVMMHKGKTIATMEAVPGEALHELEIAAVESGGSEPGQSLSERQRDALWEIVGRFGTELTMMEREQLYLLLEKYADIFAYDSMDLGRTSKLKHSIHTGDARPIRQRVRRLPLHKRAEVRSLLEDMLKKNVIQPSSSPWASPIVLVRKKNGSTRFCVDYRKLNAVTRKDAYPLPRIDETLDTLGSSKWFSTLDLISGYWQVELNPNDQEKTAFCTPEGHFEFRVLPFGLCNAPATFQRLMDLVLAGLQWSSCLVYLDDVIVVGRSFQEHLKNLQSVFERLRGAGLKLQPGKCQLLRKKVHYLGHVISRDGVSTDPSKTEKVSNWPTPTSSRDVQQFLGLASYYRRFVRDFATIAKPLHRLTERTADFCWTPQCQDAFEELRSRLVSAPVLAFPDYSREFILDTDASDTGIGAVLSQMQSDGTERVIAYASRVLTKAERRYCVTRRELLAAVTFVNHFRPYLLGKRFTLRTDHGSLTWLRNFREPEGQLARWLERLEEYDFDVVHRKGKRHGNADALSRLPCSQCGRMCHSGKEEEEQDSPREELVGLPEIAVVDVLDGVQSLLSRTAGQLQKLQQEDSVIGYVMTAIMTNQRPSPDETRSCSKETRRLIEQWDQLQVVNGLLYRNPGGADGVNSLQLVVPSTLREDILREVHGGSCSGHMGEDKTVGRLKERYYWPGFHTDVKNWCRNCQPCARRKMPVPRRHAPLGTIRAGSPMQIIAMDILGPLPESSSSGSRYILVVGDYFTRWMEAYGIPNGEAVTVAKKLVDEFFCRFSPPEQLHSDQGRQFESEIIAEICKSLHINKSRTTPYHPQSDGMVERFNRTLLNMLAIHVEEHPSDWEDHLRKVCFAYNTSIHSTTGYTPFYLMFGRQARLPIDLMYGTGVPSSSVPEYVAKMCSSLSNAYELVRQRTESNHGRQQELYDHRVHGHPLQPGEEVWLFTPAVPRGKSKKLHCPWSGPYKVVQRLSDATYRVQHLRNHRKQVVHFDRLKPCSREGGLVDRTGTGDQTLTQDLEQQEGATETPTCTSEQTRGYELELVEEDCDQYPSEPSHVVARPLPRLHPPPTPLPLPSQPASVPKPQPPAIHTHRYPTRVRRPPDRLHPYVTH